MVHTRTRRSRTSATVVAALALACTVAALAAPAAGGAAAVPETKATVVGAGLPATAGSAAPALPDPAARLGAATDPGLAATPIATLDAGFTFNTVAGLLHLARPYDARLRLSFRTSLDGITWQPWSTLPFTPDEGPPGTRRHPDDTASQPVWVGAARYLQYRVELAGEPASPRQVARLRFVFIDTVDEDAAATGAPAATSPRRAQSTRSSTRIYTRRPAMVTRAGWGANETWRRWRPSYARVKMAFVHHTAGTTEYTREQAKAIVRAVYYYHCRVLGWGDIGYNFLVDRYGTVYIGRYGGARRGVVGAQVAGFNTHSTGVSMMGTFETAQPTPEMLRSLERLLAWKLSLTRVDPLGRTVMMSYGGDRYAYGARVRLRTISAHKDVGITACPGKAAYARMAQIRQATWSFYRHKPMPLYLSAYVSPATITPNGDGSNDTATVSVYAYSPCSTRVSILDESGAEVVLLQDWTDVGVGIWPVVWDGRLPDGAGGWTTRSGPYRFKVEATDAHGHTAMVRKAVVVNDTVTGVSLKPEWFSPNGDTVKDETVVSYTLVKDATPVVAIGPAALPVRTFAAGPQPAGPYQIAWDGRDDGGAVVADGTWRVAVHAQDATGGATVVRSVSIDTVHPRPVAVDPTLRVRRNKRIDVAYRVRDRSTTTVRVRIVVTRQDSSIARDSDRGWVATGKVRTMPFKTSVPGLYTFTITAYDHAGNHEAAPAVISLRVR